MTNRAYNGSCPRLQSIGAQVNNTGYRSTRDEEFKVSNKAIVTCCLDCPEAECFEMPGVDKVSFKRRLLTE